MSLDDRRDVSGAHLETGGSETGSLLVLERLLLPQVLVVRPLLLLERLLLRLRSRHLPLKERTGAAAPFPVCLLKLFVIPALWAGFRAEHLDIIGPFVKGPVRATVALPARWLGPAAPLV